MKQQKGLRKVMATEKQIAEGRDDTASRPMNVSSAMTTILALFFVWGFLICLNDLLVPQLKFIFGLSYAHAEAVPVTFFSTCFLFSVPGGYIARRLGYKRSMALALVVMGTGALLFLLAASVGQLWCFLLALAILAAGITTLQVAAAPYIAVLGPPSQASSRFSLALGFNSLGTTVAPLVGAWLLFRGSASQATTNVWTPSALAAAQHQAVLQIRGPYLFLGPALIAIGALVWAIRLPEMTPQQPRNRAAGQIRSVLQYRPLRFGAMANFLYAGAEVGIGSLLINYLALPDTGSLSHHSAALLVSFYWGGAMLGRFLGWHVLQRLRPETALILCGGTATCLVLLSALGHGTVAVVAILAVGLCNAMIVPVITMLAIGGLGERTSDASSVMVASGIGAALMPLAIGALADRTGLHHAFLLPVVGYVFVVFYGVNGANGHVLAPTSATDPNRGAVLEAPLPTA
jgi:FHS family L-fucose permease-like MFS transporter